MSKRFTDTGIWVDKPWFIELAPMEKCAWFFIKDRCDNVGVWKPNFKMAEIMIGDSVDWQGFLEKVNGNIEILPNGKWWLPDFCEFQYGELKESCRPHQSYIQLLKRHGLLEAVLKGMDRVSIVPRKGKGKGKGKERHKHGLNKHVLLSDTNYSELCEQYGKELADEYIQRVDDYCENHGKTYSNYTNAVHTYIRNDVKRGKLALETPIKKKRCPECGSELWGGVCSNRDCGWSKGQAE